MKKTDKRRYWIGFDLGGTKMMAALFDDTFRLLASERKKTRVGEKPAAGIRRMIETIDEVLAAKGLSRDALAGVGVGCPSPVDPERGIVLGAPNLGWKNVPLAKQLKAAYPCPVAVLNDVDAGVYGEYRFGAARKARCVVGVFPGTGIGGACVYEGRIVQGRRLSCFEIGHLQVVPDGPLCGCGQRGCLEAVASRLAIASQSAAAAFRGEAPHLFKEAGTDLARIRSRMIAASIRAGDKSIERICRDAARWLGIGIAATVNLMAPDVVVLGGGLVEAMPTLFRGEVADAAEQRVMRAFRGTFDVVLAKLGDNATVTGAAAWVSETVHARAGRSS